MAVAPEMEALLRSTFDAFNRKDIDAALAAAHPDVDWPNILDGTRVVGLDDLRAYWIRQFRVIDPHLELLAVADEGDGAVNVRLHQVLRFVSDGEVVLDSVVHHVYRFRDGRIESMDVRDAQDNPVVPPYAFEP